MRNRLAILLTLLAVLTAGLVGVTAAPPSFADKGDPTEEPGYPDDPTGEETFTTDDSVVTDDTGIPVGIDAYPTVLNKACYNGNARINGGIFKWCVVAEWKRQDDGTGMRTTSYALYGTGEIGALEPTAVTGLFVSAYSCTVVVIIPFCPRYQDGTAFAGGSTGIYRSNPSWFSGTKVTNMKSEAYAQQVTMTFDIRVNNSADRHVTIRLIYGYTGGAPQRSMTCSGAAGSSCGYLTAS